MTELRRKRDVRRLAQRGAVAGGMLGACTLVGPQVFAGPAAGPARAVERHRAGVPNLLSLPSELHQVEATDARLCGVGATAVAVSLAAALAAMARRRLSTRTSRSPYRDMANAHVLRAGIFDTLFGEESSGKPKVTKEDVEKLENMELRLKQQEETAIAMERIGTMMEEMRKIMEGKVDAERHINSQLREEMADLKEQVMQVNDSYKEASVELDNTTTDLAETVEKLTVELVEEKEKAEAKAEKAAAQAEELQKRVEEAVAEKTTLIGNRQLISGEAGKLIDVVVTKDAEKEIMRSEIGKMMAEKEDLAKKLGSETDEISKMEEKLLKIKTEMKGMEGMLAEQEEEKVRIIKGKELGSKEARRLSALFTEINAPPEAVVVEAEQDTTRREAKVEELTAQIKKLTTDKEKGDKALDDLDARLEVGEKEVEVLRGQKKLIVSEVKRLIDKYTGTEREMQEMNDVIDGKHQEMDRLTERGRQAEELNEKINARIKKAKDEVKEAEKELSKAEAESDKVTAQKDLIAGEARRLSGKVADTTKLAEELAAKRAELEGQRNKLSDLAAELANQKAYLESRAADMEVERSKLTKKMLEMHNKRTRQVQDTEKALQETGDMRQQVKDNARKRQILEAHIESSIAKEVEMAEAQQRLWQERRDSIVNGEEYKKHQTTGAAEGS